MNKYQHCISSTNSSISIDINIFGGCNSKKARGAVCKWRTISKKNWISQFFGQKQKSNTQAS